eukprot:g10293.t1
MTACLVGSVPEGGLTEDVAEQQHYRLINGNHRLAALLRLVEEDKVADPPRTSTEAIEVDVHVGLSLERERLIASNLNTATELVVKTTLSDRVLWYKAWHDDIQSKHKGKTAMSPNLVANKLIAESKKSGVAMQSAPTVKKLMKIVQAMKPRGLAALHDVTHLPGRDFGHWDVAGTQAKPVPKLQHSRVTAVSLERPEFAALSGVEQEAYIYRLASIGEFPGVVSADNYLTLDQTAKDVARMIVTAENHFGPVSRWSDDFKRFIYKARNYEGCAKFVTHFNGRISAAENYKSGLPAGMAADETYVQWIKSQPWSPLVKLIEGSEAAPHEMKDVFDAYAKVRDDKAKDANAAAGLFKTELAEKVKAATEAAAAAAAAKAALELEAKIYAAAESAKAAAAASQVTAAEATVTPAAPSATAQPATGYQASQAASTTPVDPAAPAPGVSPSSSASPKTASVTAKGGAAKVGAQLSGAKRKADRGDASNELLKKARPVMTKLVGVDILSKANATHTELTIQHPAGKPLMLAFVNVAEHVGVVTSDDGATLITALSFLADNLHDRGTVVIALPDWEFNRTKLKVWFRTAGLVLEESPVVSLFLHGKSGRLARKDKFVFPTQGSVTLVAHKGENFICNGGGPRSGGDISSRASRGGMLAPPRTMELDRIGVVVSLAHPPAGTFLAESTADFLLKRFSDVGDSVLVSGGHRDMSLAQAILREGRVAIVLEPTALKLAETTASLDKLTGSAAKEGMWARMLKVYQPLVTVGSNQLPFLVPASNIPVSTAAEVDALRKYSDADPERPRRESNRDAWAGDQDSMR